MRAAVCDGENGGQVSHPLRGIFAGCYASAIAPKSSCTTTTKIDDKTVFVIAYLFREQIYHDYCGWLKCYLRQKGIPFVEGSSAKFV